MESTVSVVIADLYMEIFEKQAIKSLVTFGAT